MVVARAIVVFALAGGVCAQVRVQTMFDCSDVTPLLAERHGPAWRESDTVKELQWLLDRFLRGDDNRGFCGLRVQGASHLLVVASAAEQVQFVQRALDEVRTGTLEVRVQCTVFATPASEGRALATHKDIQKADQPIDVVTAGRLIKAAVAAGGTLRNLPEAGAPPLVPFVMKAADVSVGCRALVLGDDEVALAVHREGEGAVGTGRFVRVKVGSGALLTYSGRTQTTCVWVRV